eukprot:scaffold25618_cov57-Attheya_sp.AAC.1
MDNDAFKALVRERATPKTTKAIAREAVEDELDRRRLQRRRRGKRRSADDGSSSSESEDENNDETDTAKDDETETANSEEPKWKELRRNKNKRAKEDPESYRDRAKERREGKNLDYQSTAALELQQQQQSSQNDMNNDNSNDNRKDMSQYLGGDVEHTHLVKGLDLALAQKVRREEMAQGDPLSATRKLRVDHEHEEEIDLDQVMHQAKQQQQQQQHDQRITHTHINKSRTMEQVLQKLRVHPPTTEVGRSMWTYFLEKSNSKGDGGMEKSTSSPTVAGLAVQRSTMTFSTVARVGDKYKAWELPKEHTLAASLSLSSSNKQHNMNMSHSGLVQWDEPLMKRIQMALDEHDHEEQTRIQTQASKRKKKRTYKELTKSSSSLDNNGGTNNQQDDSIVATATAQNEKEESDDSEDDIFQNVGTYVPPRIIAINEMTKQMDSSSPSSLKMGMNNVTNTSDPNNETKPNIHADVSKGSIFSGLLPVAPVPVVVVKPKARPNINQNQNLSQPGMSASHAGAVIIDRDLFGLKGDPQESVPLTAEQGFSTTNYGGEYGEEMDEDEDDEEEGEQDKDDIHNDYKRKKTKDSLTMGAKDYGKRDNNKASHHTKNSTNDPEMM